MRFPTLAACAALAVAISTGAGVAHERRIIRVEQSTRQVYISGGTFAMGVDEVEAQELIDECVPAFDPSASTSVLCTVYGEELLRMGRHDVYLDAYFLDRDEVSVADYRRCVAAGGCTLDALVAGDERYITDDGPLVNVTWAEARTYCTWRGGRLPTEAEWERAARGHDQRTWPWGSVARDRDWNHGKVRDPILRRLETVTQQVSIDLMGDPDDTDGALIFAPASRYPWGEADGGIRNLAGNVAEWVADAHVNTLIRAQPTKPGQPPPPGEAGYQVREENDEDWRFIPSINPLREGDLYTHRVVRGGSWRQPAFLGRSYARDPFNLFYEPNRRYPHVGFRCARSL